MHPLCLLRLQGTRAVYTAIRETATVRVGPPENCNRRVPGTGCSGGGVSMSQNLEKEGF